MLGPERLYGMLSEGLDLQSYVAKFFRENAGNKKTSATLRYVEMEAETLATMIKVTLFDAECPITVVENSPWMEIALWSYFTILQIEETVAR